MKELPCSVCGKVYPVTSEFFPMDKRRKDGFDTWCRKCHAIYNREYRKINEEKLKKYDALYYKANKKSIDERHKKYIATGIYTNINNAKRKASRKRWAVKNKEKVCIIYETRRSIKKSLPSTLTLSQWKTIKQVFKNKCAYCGREENLVQDHFVSVKNGGEYTHNNIVPSCRSCNCRKSAKSFFEWYPTYEYYSEKREKAVLGFLGYDSIGYQQLKFAETQ